MDYDTENRVPSNVLKEKNSSKNVGGKKTIEETYTKKTQLEHILLRPDTYSKFYNNYSIFLIILILIIIIIY